MLIDLKPQSTLLIILGKLAQLWVLLSIRKKSFLQVCVVGINFGKVIVFVEIELGDLLLFTKSCCHKTTRSIAVILVLCNEVGAIGFVLTAKSLARYKQLDNQKFAEKDLVGTLSSTAIAICVALLLK